jgi:hypothetical protein
MKRFIVCLGAVGLAACASSAPEGGLRSNGTLPSSNGLSVARRGGDAGRQGPAGSGLGSATAYTSADLGMLTVVPSPLDSAYTALTKAYLSLGLPVTRDPSAHVVGDDHVVVMRTMLGRRLSAFLNCGADAIMGSPRADTYQVTFSVMSTLSSADSGRTRVVTLVTGQASDLATSASSVYCSSTGLMERTLLKAAGFQPS